MSEGFDDFLKGWIAERIVALGSSGVDPGDRDLVIQRRAAELSEQARARGFYSDLLRTAQHYGNVPGYVRALYRSVEKRN